MKTCWNKIKLTPKPKDCLTRVKNFNFYCTISGFLGLPLLGFWPIGMSMASSGSSQNFFIIAMFSTCLKEYFWDQQGKSKLKPESLVKIWDFPNRISCLGVNHLHLLGTEQTPALYNSCEMGSCKIFSCLLYCFRLCPSSKVWQKAWSSG